MAKYGKWIGAGLGFVMGGPIGALFGYFIGSTFDTATVVTSGPGNDPGTRPTGRGDFLLSLVVLATALMKADGKVTRNELDYVKKFFRDNFGQEVWGIERSVFFNGREKWAKGVENQRV